MKRSDINQEYKRFLLIIRSYVILPLYLPGTDARQQQLEIESAC